MAADTTINAETRVQDPRAGNPGLPRRTIRIVMAGGGTGGHLYPGLAVGEALTELATEQGASVELIWAATPRAVDQHLLSRFGDHYVPQPVQPMVRKVRKILPFLAGWFYSCRIWKRSFAQHRPDAVLALGGYAAGPAAYIAAKGGIPVGLLNPDAVPGLANRLLLRKAGKVFVQWPLPAEMGSRVRGQVVVTGCPIRKGLTGCDRAEAAAKLGLDPAKKTLVITGGSLAAKSINDAMIALVADAAFVSRMAAEGWQILHLAGADQAAMVKAAYEPIKTLAARVLEYCDDMASVYTVADVAIGRAGASTCAELTACGVPAVLMPYPYHKDQHQRRNAERLAEVGAAVIVDDQKESFANATAVKQALDQLLYDQQRRSRMASQARAAGKPAAARAVATEVLAMLSPHL